MGVFQRAADKRTSRRRETVRPLGDCNWNRALRWQPMWRASSRSATADAGCRPRACQQGGSALADHLRLNSHGCPRLVAAAWRRPAHGRRGRTSSPRATHCHRPGHTGGGLAAPGHRGLQLGFALVGRCSMFARKMMGVVMLAHNREPRGSCDLRWRQTPGRPLVLWVIWSSRTVAAAGARPGCPLAAATRSTQGRRPWCLR